MPWYFRILAMVGAIAILYTLKDIMDSAAGCKSNHDSEFTVYMLWVWSGML